MSPITTHVLDTTLGRPAAGMPVRLEVQARNGNWERLATAETDQDGRITNWTLAKKLSPGAYRLIFDTRQYFTAQKREVFYPEIQVMFNISGHDQHWHIPLLLSTYGYSTYRGS